MRREEGLALFSVRMRAAAGGSHEAGGRHVSGAERIVPEGMVLRVVADLLRRARQHGQGEADFINITVERISGPVIGIKALPVVTVGVSGPAESRNLALALLERAGVAPMVAEKALSLIESGPAPGGGPMRGAVVMDALSGERLEPDPARGVRVSRVDWAGRARTAFVRRLKGHGVGGEAIRRVCEALAVASKVAWAGVRAELCISDNPGYTTGYVAGPALGYVRLPFLKPDGAAGGRVFFVDGGNFEEGRLRLLQSEPVLLVEGPCSVSLVPGEGIQGWLDRRSI